MPAPLPTLLPGGRPVTDDAARAEVEQAWGLAPARCRPYAGPDTDAILAAAASGGLAGLVVGGVDPDDLPDPATAARAAFHRRLRGEPGVAAPAR